MHLFKNALVSSPSSTALRDERFSHAAEAVGVDHTEFLVGVYDAHTKLGPRPPLYEVGDTYRSWKLVNLPD